MAFADLDDFITREFSQDRWHSDTVLASNLLHYRRSVDQAYRDRHRHSPAYRQRRAGNEQRRRDRQPAPALMRRVWREVQQQRREDARLRWIRREAVAWVLAEIRRDA